MKQSKSIFLLLYLVLSISFIISSISCSKKTNITSSPVIIDPSAKTYLALGDSYTIGQSVDEHERFPNQTIELLRAQNIKISDPRIVATTGWTTKNLIDAINPNTLADSYSIVTLLIGVNNQYQGRSLDEYKTEFTLLLNRAIQFAGNNKSHVFLLSIPDYSVTPFASGSDTQKIANEIDSFNLANKNISEQLGVNYLDITPISRKALNDPSLTANDGLHPSGNQYKMWADLLAPLLKQVL